jgi:hypothetical protein
MKSGGLSLLETSGPVQACNRDCFYRLSYEEPLQECGKAQFGLRRLHQWRLHLVEGIFKL